MSKEYKNWMLNAILASILIKLFLILFGHLVQVPNPDAALLSVFQRNDAFWYQSIVDNGYITSLPDLYKQSNVVFFPLYPLLVAGIKLLVNNYLWAASISSCLLLVWLMYSIFNYFKKYNLSGKQIFWFTLFLQAIPFHYFLHVHYSELLFLVLLINLINYAETKKALGVLLFSFLLVLCRPTGLLFAFSIAISSLASINYRLWLRKANLVFLLAFTGAPLALLGFSAYLHFHMGNAMAFSQNQMAWNRHYTMPWHSFIEAGLELKSLVWYVIGLLVVAAYSIKIDRYKNAWIILPNLIFPLFTGTVLSYYRFFMVTFPVFSSLALHTRFPYKKWLIALLFIFNLATYAYWVRNLGVLSY